MRRPEGLRWLGGMGNGRWEIVELLDEVVDVECARLAWAPRMLGSSCRNADVLQVDPGRACKVHKREKKRASRGNR